MLPIGETEAQHDGEQRLLLLLADEAHMLVDPLDGRRRGCDADFGRIGQELVASSRMVLGMVAEKNSVWRFAGSMVTIFLSAWMKPRSSIWSASSSTRISTSRRVR